MGEVLLSFIQLAGQQSRAVIMDFRAEGALYSQEIARSRAGLVTQLPLEQTQLPALRQSSEWILRKNPQIFPAS